MVYKFNEYVAAFPKKPVSILKKFENEPKNLHEMSIEEINAIIASWGGTTPATAMNRKSMIKLYLDWLVETGVPVKANPEEIVVPVKNAEFFIYTSEILHKYWDRYLKSCEREAAKSGEFHSRARYLTSYVSGILSFYGLTAKQILALDLSDVQPSGIANYDIPLTQTDIDVLLEYKGLNELANNKKVIGTKYIRSAGTVTEDTLDYGIAHGACGKDVKTLKRILTCKNVYKLGRYAEIYAEEKRTGKLVDLSNRAIPADWFIKQIGLIVGGEVKPARITAYKKDYEAYRSERMESEAKQNIQPATKVEKPVVAEQKPDVSGLLEALKYVDVAIAEVDRIKVNLLGIKAQIARFVK